MAPSVVVDDFHVVGVAVAPAKADSPLLGYPDAVLPVSITAKSFEVIVGWHSKVL